jgi:hypothetical protein
VSPFEKGAMPYAFDESYDCHKSSLKVVAISIL